MNAVAKTIAMGVLLFAGASASAAELICSGTIEQVHLHAPDRMMIKLSGMNTPVFFCNPSSLWSISGTSYTTSAETCRMLVGLFMAGKLAGRSISAMYFDGDDVPASCTSWAGWKYANIRYFAWAD